MLTRQDRGFEIIPAVDVLAGRAVRLSRGRAEHVTVEGGDPVELARRWANQGAARIHLVNLDGAFSGEANTALVARIAETGVAVQFGGGLRTLAALEAALEGGADRVIIGTAALDSGFLARALARLGEALVVAIDAAGDRLAIEGWVRSVDVAPAAFARRCAAAGVGRFLVTATHRDGSLGGPDLALLGGVVEAGVPVVAAGGIATTADIRAVRGLGCEAAVVGTALLQGRLSFREARAEPSEV